MIRNHRELNSVSQKRTGVRAGRKTKNFLESESPLFVGRAVVALAEDEALFSAATVDEDCGWPASADRIGGMKRRRFRRG